MESARVRYLRTSWWCVRNRTSERSERVRFLIQTNECVNTVQSTFHVVLCLLYTYRDLKPSLMANFIHKCKWNKTQTWNIKCKLEPDLSFGFFLVTAARFFSAFCFDYRHFRINSNCMPVYDTSRVKCLSKLELDSRLRILKLEGS